MTTFSFQKSNASLTYGFFVNKKAFVNLFTSPEPSGSQDNLIVSVHPVASVVIRRRPPFSKIFSFGTAWPIKAKKAMSCGASMGRGN